MFLAAIAQLVVVFLSLALLVRFVHLERLFLWVALLVLIVRPDRSFLVPALVATLVVSMPALLSHALEVRIAQSIHLFRYHAHHPITALLVQLPPFLALPLVNIVLPIQPPLPHVQSEIIALLELLPPPCVPSIPTTITQVLPAVLVVCHAVKDISLMLL